MIVLDTDHVTHLKFSGSAKRAAILARLEAASREAAITIITVEEQFRGWFAEIGRLRDSRLQGRAYAEVGALLTFFGAWTILQFDDRAADEFDRLGTLRLRLGTMDLKIAAIALVNKALLLSANARDFERVPGLNVANWTV